MQREYQVYCRSMKTDDNHDYGWSEPVLAGSAVAAVKHLIAADGWGANQIRIVKVVATGELIELYI